MAVVTEEMSVTSNDQVFFIFIIVEFCNQPCSSLTCVTLQLTDLWPMIQGQQAKLLCVPF